MNSRWLSKPILTYVWQYSVVYPELLPDNFEVFKAVYKCHDQQLLSDMLLTIDRPKNYLLMKPPLNDDTWRIALSSGSITNILYHTDQGFYSVLGNAMLDALWHRGSYTSIYELIDKGYITRRHMMGKMVSIIKMIQPSSVSVNLILRSFMTICDRLGIKNKNLEWGVKSDLTVHVVGCWSNVDSVRIILPLIFSYTAWNYCLDHYRVSADIRKLGEPLVKEAVRATRRKGNAT